MTRSDIGYMYLVRATAPTIYANSFETLLFTGDFVMVSVFYIICREFFSLFQDMDFSIQCYQCLYIDDTLCLLFFLKLTWAYVMS